MDESIPYVSRTNYDDLECLWIEIMLPQKNFNKMFVISSYKKEKKLY